MKDEQKMLEELSGVCDAKKVNHIFFMSYKDGEFRAKTGGPITDIIDMFITTINGDSRQCKRFREIITATALALIDKDEKARNAIREFLNDRDFGCIFESNPSADC